MNAIFMFQWHYLCISGEEETQAASVAAAEEAHHEDPHGDDHQKPKHDPLKMAKDLG